MTPNKIGWDSLFFMGSIVDIEVKVWPARTRIRPSDVDVEDTPEVRQALSLGSTRLAPKATINKMYALAREAKRVLDDHSFNFPFIKGCRFIPEGKMESLLEQMRSYQSRFGFLADEDFGEEGIEEIKRNMEPVIRKALSDANCKDIKYALERIMNEYPSDVRDRFSFSWKIYAIQGAKSKAAAEAIEEEAENVKSVVREMVTQIREEFTEKVVIISKAVARGGKLKSNVAAAANEVLARVEEMNLFGDVVLNKQIRALRALIEKASGMDDISGLEKDMDSIKTALDVSLEEAVRNAESSLTTMGRRRIQAPKEVA